MRGVNAYIAQSLASSIPAPILYHNFFVGECKDLIFGFSLQDYATARDLPEGEIPKIVKVCIEEVDKRGLDAEGIYRVSRSHVFSFTPALPGGQVSGRVASVNEVSSGGAQCQESCTQLLQLRHRIEKDEEAFRFYPTDDIYVVASLLKVRRKCPPKQWASLTCVQGYLRELPEPLFRFSSEDRIQHTVDFGWSLLHPIRLTSDQGSLRKTFRFRFPARSRQDSTSPTHP